VLGIIEKGTNIIIRNSTPYTNPSGAVVLPNAFSYAKVNQDGFGDNVSECSALCVYDNRLYVGTSRNANVYCYDSGTSWNQVSENHLGNPANLNVPCLSVYNNKLFAGTQSWGIGLQIWPYNGSSWNQEDQNGFGNSHNTDAYSMIGFTDQLYVGSIKQVWRTTSGPASSFCFAEGYTGDNFAEYLCLGNPNATAATASVTYLFSDGTTKPASYSVPATGRTTVNVNNEVGAGKEVSMGFSQFRRKNDDPRL